MAINARRTDGKVVWLTGFSAAGKTTLATKLHERLVANEIASVVLDGDLMRRGLCRDLGFSREDRAENVRRVAEVGRIFADAGFVCVVALVSPYRTDRELAREIIGAARFFDVFIDAPLEVCRRRDPKGLYRKADAGAIPAFTGVSDPYEPPLTPFLRIQTDSMPVEECLDLLHDAVTAG